MANILEHNLKTLKHVQEALMSKHLYKADTFKIVILLFDRLSFKFYVVFWLNEEYLNVVFLEVYDILTCIYNIPARPYDVTGDILKGP